MGRIAVLLSFVRAAVTSDVKVNRGGGDNRTADHFCGPGDDSHPLPGDLVVLVGQAGTGRDSAVGYIDKNNAKTSAAGEKRLYARNSAGEQVAQVWIKNDGSILGNNENGVFELQAGGNFVVNGVTIDTAGNITSPATITAPNLVGNTSVIAGGKELRDHNHSQGNDSAGDVQQDTGDNN